MRHSEPNDDILFFTFLRFLQKVPNLPWQLPKNQQASLNYLKRKKQQSLKGLSQHWLIFFTPDCPSHYEVIGAISTRHHLTYDDISCSIRPDKWRQGIAFEALSNLLPYLSKSTPQWQCHLHNSPSLALAQKLGFTPSTTSGNQCYLTLNTKP